MIVAVLNLVEYNNLSQPVFFRFRIVVYANHVTLYLPMQTVDMFEYSI
jgi:hypothetical protein